MRDADRVVGLLGDEPHACKLIVNRLRPALVRKGKMLSVDDVNGILHLPLLGVIADAPDVIVSTNRGEPVALDAASPVGEAYRADRAADRRARSPTRRRSRARRSFFEKLFGGRTYVFEFFQRLFGKPAVERDREGAAAAGAAVRSPLARARRRRSAQARSHRGDLALRRGRRRELRRHLRAAREAGRDAREHPDARDARASGAAQAAGRRRPNRRAAPPDAVAAAVDATGSEPGAAARDAAPAAQQPAAAGARRKAAQARSLRRHEPRAGVPSRAEE